jgi:putative membrane protein
MNFGGWLWMGIWIVALVVLVWLITRSPDKRGQQEPLDILRTRFARGEISQAEYEQARRVLEPDRSPNE